MPNRRQCADGLEACTPPLAKALAVAPHMVTGSNVRFGLIRYNLNAFDIRGKSPYARLAAQRRTLRRQYFSFQKR